MVFNPASPDALEPLSHEEFIHTAPDNFQFIATEAPPIFVDADEQTWYIRDKGPEPQQYAHLREMPSAYYRWFLINK